MIISAVSLWGVGLAGGYVAGAHARSTSRWDCTGPTGSMGSGRREA